MALNAIPSANIKLGDVRVGDALIFKNAGAYSFAEGMIHICIILSLPISS